MRALEEKSLRMKILQLLLKYFGYRLQGSVVSAVAPVGPYLKQLSLGLAGVFLGVACFIFAFLFLALSFFFFLIERPEWASSGLWTCFAIASAGGICFGAGFHILRKPFPTERL